MQELREAGIDARPFFHPLHTMPPYKQSQSYPTAEELSRKGVCLPSASVLAKEQIRMIGGAVRMALGA